MLHYNHTGSSLTRRKLLKIGGLAGGTLIAGRVPNANARSYQVVTLQCLGDLHNPAHLYLNGRTDDGSVGLAPNNTFSGTFWNFLPNQRQGWALFSCRGDNPNSQHVWLNGNTHDGSVSLVPTIDPPYTGTRWLGQGDYLENAVGATGVITLKCLGDVADPQFQFLDGGTQYGTVGLAPAANEPYHGTSWRITVTSPAHG